MLLEASEVALTISVPWSISEPIGL
jgi:hypothetical protein